MKTATIKEIKYELSNRSPDDLFKLCLRLANFKKENKELLTYLLYEASDETAYIESIKGEMDQEFSKINTKSFFYIKKSVRKILRNIKKYIRYSKKKESEVELLLYFCSELKKMNPSISKNTALQNLYNRQIDILKKTIGQLHEDLQYDFGKEIEAIEEIKN